jgi:hypothetical protein
MSRVRLIVSAAIVAMGAALAGCSSAPSWMPDWLSPKPATPPLQTLQFESAPPGADVRTAQGQTCQTPCSLAVQSITQSVAFAKPGFLPQTVQVSASEPDHSLFDSPPPALSPNPVEVTLQAALPPHRPPPAKPRKPVARPASAPQPSQQPSAFPPPQR